MSDHKKLNLWVEEMAALCQPDQVVWISGSEKEKKKLEEEALVTKELVTLDSKKLPGCFYHRTHPSDVARTENLTFICTPKKEDAGPTNNWMSPADAYKKAADLFRGAMKGRTMYVVPFAMGLPGSSFCKIGVELTDSIYVVLNMRIMTRIGQKVLDSIGKNGEFTKCLHSKADLDINRRLILHFPQDNTIWSVGSGYGGNVLLGKKCLALRVASYLARQENWMAEHMLILGLKSKAGKMQYVTGAFPSACGKTNLAMIVPPKSLSKKKYTVSTVGDDIAWMRPDKKGTLLAVNPESGFFGVLPGTNLKSNPNAIKTIQKNTIFTNVLLKPDNTVWWEGGDEQPPAEGVNWEGKPWHPGMTDANGKKVLGAHPNSRFTAPFSQCPTAPKGTSHLKKGVPVSAIIFGGRRAKLTPLVFEAFNWQHGVFVGATMASERTAAQFGKQGEVRYDPMAMVPFCGYNMADYFQHWLKMGKIMGKKAPRIFCVNWFKQDENGKFLWPGYGENLRIVEWILNRCNGKVGAIKTPIGFIPDPKDIDLSGLDLSAETMKDLFAINKEEWAQELNSQQAFFNQFEGRLPSEINQEYEGLKGRFNTF
ncbi:MAG: phosphoenolpyruvate carboxykinase (GTP) [Candidatus Omnitrophota bacterium]